MNTEELLWMLRNNCGVSKAAVDAAHQAADRIEELEAQGNYLWDSLVKVSRMHDEAEAKLAKAVEALEWVKFGGGPTGESYYLNTVDTLKEMKGETNE